MASSKASKEVDHETGNKSGIFYNQDIGLFSVSFYLLLLVVGCFCCCLLIFNFVWVA